VCFIVLIGLLSPRLAIILLAIFSDILSRAYDSWVIPLLGFFLLPWTTFVYALMWDSGAGHHVVGIEWVLVGVAVLLDLSSWGFGRRYQSARD
jgi:hypothetical protein